MCDRATALGRVQCEAFCLVYVGLSPSPLKQCEKFAAHFFLRADGETLARCEYHSPQFALLGISEISFEE
jgi:hypothetical protein